MGAMRHRRGRRGDSGASAVEFALVVPLLLLLVFGIIQFGMTFAQVLALNNASRQGARVGVVALNNCSVVISQVQQASSGGIGMTYPINVTVSRAGTTLCTATVPATGTPAITYVGTQGATDAVCPSQSSTQALTVSSSSTGTFTIPPFFFLSSFTVTGNGVFQCELS